jgi:hypothetical protein
MVAVELEVMAKKMDRFGWERDRGSMAHDRLVSDWMDALHDYTIDEVQAACREWVMNNPRRMPNEGDIVAEVKSIRAEAWAKRKATLPPEPDPERPRVTAEAAAEIMARAGFKPKAMPK